MNIEPQNLVSAIPLIAIVSGLLGYFIKYYFDKKKEFASKNAEVKREIYQDFVNLVISFFEDVDQAKQMSPGQAREKQIEFKNKMYKFNRKYILYASPGVVRAVSGFMHHFYSVEEEDGVKSTRKALSKMTKVFKVMRKDIGLSNWWLDRNGKVLMKSIIRDYDFLAHPIRWRIKSWLGLYSKKKSESQMDNGSDG